MTFEKELSDLINKHSMENASGTPDFILAIFLKNVLQVFGDAMQARDHHNRVYPESEKK